MKSCQADVLTLSRQVKELKTQLDLQRKDADTVVDALRAEMLAEVASAKTEAQDGLHQMGELSNSMLHMLKSE